MQETPTAQQPLQTLHRPTYTPPMPQPPEKPRGTRKRLWLLIGIVAAALLVGGIIGGIVGAAILPTTSPATQSTQQATTQPVPTQEAATPTETIQPIQIPAQSEEAFKGSTMATTVTTLDKQGNNYKGQYVHFTCILASFVKDSHGNTASANVYDPKSSGVILVGFPSGIDLGKLNTRDTLEVWGVDIGTVSGTNGFGATIQEVAVVALYITDQTTGYATH